MNIYLVAISFYSHVTLYAQGVDHNSVSSMSQVKEAIGLSIDSGSSAFFSRIFTSLDINGIKGVDIVFCVLLLALIILSVSFFVFRRRVNKVAPNLVNLNNKADYKIEDLDAILEMLPVGVGALSAEGILIEVNERCLELMGVLDENLVKDLSIESSPNFPESIKEAIRKRESIQTVFSYDFSTVRKTNLYKTVRKNEKARGYFKGKPIFNSFGEYEKYLFVIEDITETYNKKQILSETQRNLSLALEIGDIAVWGYDLALKHFYSIQAHTPEDKLILFEKRIALVHPDDVHKVTDVFEKFAKGEILKSTISFRFMNVNTNEYEYLRTDMIVVLSEDGEAVDRIVGVRRNIDAEIRHKQKIDQAMSYVKLSVQSTRTLMWYVEEGDFYLFNNNAFVKTKYSLSSLLEHMHPDDRERCVNTYNALLSGSDCSCDKEIFRVDDKLTGDYNYLECSFRAIKDNDGKVYRIVGGHNNITQRKRADIKNENLQKALNMAMGISNIIAWTEDLQTNTVDTIYGSIEGLDVKEKRFWAENIHPDDIDKCTEYLKNVIGGAIKDEPILINIKKGDVYGYAECVLALLYNEQGEPMHLIGSLKDLTEIHNLNESLNNLYNESQVILQSLPVDISVYDKNGRQEYINDTLIQIFGINDIETHKKKRLNLFKDTTLPLEIRNRIKNGECFDHIMEYDLQTGSDADYFNTSYGHKMYIEGKARNIKDSNGEIIKYILILTDITEKQKEIVAIKNIRECLDMAMQFSSILSWTEDLHTGKTEIIYGAIKNLYLDDQGSCISSILTQDKDVYESYRDKIIAGAQNEAPIFLNIKKGEGSGYFECTLSLLSDEKGEHTLLVGLMKDLTEIHNLNESLNDQYNESQILLESLPLGVSVFDKDCKQQYLNESLAQIFGISDREAHLRLKLNLLEDPILTLDTITKLKRGEDFNDIIEYDMQKASDTDFFNTMYGHKMYFHGIVKCIKDRNKNIVKYILIVNDITEKHRAELTLEDSERNLKLALEAGSVDAWSYNVALETFYYVGGDSFGVDPVALDDDNNLLYPDDLKLRVDLMADIVEGKVDEGQIIIRYKTSAMQNQYRYYDTRLLAKKENGVVVAISFAQRDITEKYSAELILEASERNMRIALEAGSVEAWSYDVKSKIFYYLGGHSTFGQAPILQDDDDKLVHPDDLKLRNDMMDAIIEGKTDKGRIILRLRSDLQEDKYRYYDTRMIAQKENSVVSVIHITHKDITDDYLQEIEKEYNHKKIEFAIDSAELALWEYDVLKNEFVLYNHDAVGFEPVNGLSIQDYKDSLNLDEYSNIELNMMTSAMNVGADILNTAEIRIKPKSASTDEDEWMHYTIGGSIFEKNKEGRVIKYVGYIKNNTKWIALNETLVDLNTQLKTVLGIGEIHPFTCILKNDKFYFRAPIGETRIFFMDLDTELTLDKVLQFFCPESRENMENIANDVINGDISQARTEIRWNTEAMKDKIHEMTISVVRDEDFKGSLKMIGYMQDVTERKHMISELEEAKREAEKSVKLKSAFLANMSHEIRTPLNAIVGFSELLADEEDDKKKAEFIGIISTNNDLLLKLINDVLDLSKIDAGFVEVNESAFDFAQFFNELHLSMQQRITTPNVTLSVINPYSKCIVELDKNRLAQVCINYITNAIKYTSEGVICMGYECINNGIRLYVKDSGIGIDDNKKHKVFQRFEKLDDFAQGTGLGLSITKALVESMKGEIGFESESGYGSTFWAWIPFISKLKDDDIVGLPEIRSNQKYNKNDYF